MEDITSRVLKHIEAFQLIIAIQENLNYIQKRISWKFGGISSQGYDDEKSALRGEEKLLA